jgi:hypothetical protein
VSDNQRSNSQGIEYLRTLSTETLDNLILSVSLEDEIDTDFLDELLKVISERRFINVDVASAYQEFLDKYSGQEEIYPYDTTQTNIRNATVSPPGRRRVLRLGLAAVIATILLLAGTITASALGYDLFGSITQWTRDTFRFSASGRPPASSSGLIGDDGQQADYESLEEALQKKGITDPLIPQWIPDGFELTEFSVSETEDFTVFFAYYENEDRTLGMQIIAHQGQAGTHYEKDEGDVSVYVRGGNEHYIMTNISVRLAIWSVGNYECSIYGDIAYEELITMIDSIYER